MNKNLFAQTPPMGWNSYDYYNTMVTEEDVKKNADYMAANLKEYGWEYIVIDIEWYAKGVGSKPGYQYIPFSTLEMDEYGRLLPDLDRFPSAKDGAGFKPLADYVHALGLKFGIHIMRGLPRPAAAAHLQIKGSNVTADDLADPSNICFWNPDMYGTRDLEAAQAYYDSIMELYAQWGVDFIKCDDICRMDNPSSKREIEMLHKAIEKCGRAIVLSLSPGPALLEQAFCYEKNANMWRITDDMWDNFDLVKNMFWRCELWQYHVSAGNFPDCDMLPFGKLGKGFGGGEWTCNLTPDEQKTMMSLWCIFGSPLMLGAEMTLMDDFTVSLLTNKEILAMLPPHCPGRQLNRTEDFATWTALDQKTGDVYVALFNLSDETRSVSATIEEITLFNAMDAEAIPANAAVKELWTNERSSFEGDTLTATLAPHACAVYKLV